MNQAFTAIVTGAEPNPKAAIMTRKAAEYVPSAQPKRLRQSYLVNFMYRIRARANLSSKRFLSPALDSLLKLRLTGAFARVTPVALVWGMLGHRNGMNEMKRLSGENK
jgi:hypothetical protein